ncbi:MAG TPA: type II secretion system F family protein [Tepidisphaeraceae bacterium]|jgi:tight adherence protein B|nr:type II secretion system F family protein [Tepidisphaeraceae bacterium]
MTTLIPILVAGCVILLTWGLMSFFIDPERAEKRQLSKRLSSDALATNSALKPRQISLTLEDPTLPAALARLSLMRHLQRRVIQAYPDVPLSRFLLIAVAAGTMGGLTAGGVTGSMFMAAVVGGFLAYVPFFVLNTKRSNKQKLIAEQLPEALDFLARVLRAGHSLTTGLQMMGDELPKPLALEFRRCYDQHSLGQPLEDSLKDMIARVESTDFAFFVTSVLIQRSTGGDLSEVLNNISGMIRARIRLQSHVKAKTAEGRFTGYILVAFPAIMFMLTYIMSPEHASKLLHTDQGLKMLGLAFGLQVVGLWAIKRITTVKV